MFAKHYAKYYNLFNSDKPYREELEFVFRWADFPKSILDIGCGTAEYWKYLPPIHTIQGIEKSRWMRDLSPYKEKIRVGKIQDFSHYVFSQNFDLAMALFDVVNYVPDLSWFGSLPIKPGGYFIFDIFDKEKVDQEGFKETSKKVGHAYRKILPGPYDGKSVTLHVEVRDGKEKYDEFHEIFVHSHEDVLRSARDHFDVIDRARTKKWQTWYRLRKK